MSSTRSNAEIPGARWFRRVSGATLIATLSLSVEASAQEKVTEAGGTLPDGTVFLMRVPSNWNKILIRAGRYTALGNAMHVGMAGWLAHRLMKEHHRVPQLITA